MEEYSPRPNDTEPSDRNRQWASTMNGFTGASEQYSGKTHQRLSSDGDAAPGIRFAHKDSCAGVDTRAHASHMPDNPASIALTRPNREELEERFLSSGATRSTPGGKRTTPEEPDKWRTCFEIDRDRILHSNAFRRLAGKTQVFVFPEDHQRTRLTHALEVAQVATAISRACGLNVALTEAIALGHDCGHGPGGHASEDAFEPYLDGGFDHAPWGANVSLSTLNLCDETLDGIRNHSWSRPAPRTPEGEVVSWADRIAYVCHDWEDAVVAGVVNQNMLPKLVSERCGTRRSHQLGTFINAVTDTVIGTGRIGMDEEHAEALSSFRTYNYEHIYLRKDSLDQASAVISLLRALVDHYIENPAAIPSDDLSRSNSKLLNAGDDANRVAVTYVAGMTDRFAFRRAIDELGWDVGALPISATS